MPETFEQGAGPARIFVSYAREDVSFVRNLVQALTDDDFVPLFDRHGAPHGDDWRRVTAEMIAESEAVVFVLSDDWSASSMCRWQFSEAMLHRKRVQIVTFKPVSENGLPKPMAKLKRIACWNDPSDFNANEASGLAALSQALKAGGALLGQGDSQSGLAPVMSPAGPPAAEKPSYDPPIRHEHFEQQAADDLLQQEDARERFLEQWSVRSKPGARQRALAWCVGVLVVGFAVLSFVSPDEAARSEGVLAATVATTAPVEAPIRPAVEYEASSSRALTLPSADTPMAQPAVSTPAAQMMAGPRGSRVRSKPSVSSDPLLMLSAGVRVNVTGVVSDNPRWFQVALDDGRSGYVREDVLVTVSAPSPAPVDAKPYDGAPLVANPYGVMVMSSPSDLSEPLAMLANVKLRTTGVVEQPKLHWFQIVLDDGRTGFVREDQVQFCTQQCVSRQD